MSKLVLDLKVTPEYEPQAVKDIIRAICNQVNALSEGRITAKYQASSVAPSGSVVAYTQGDIVWNSNPTELNSVAPGVAAKYILIGWMNVSAGSPGTIKELRVLTGN